MSSTRSVMPRLPRFSLLMHACIPMSLAVAQPVMVRVDTNHTMTVRDISDDLSTLSGSGEIFSWWCGFRWTAAGGTDWLQPAGGTLYCFVQGVDHNGSTIVGHTLNVLMGSPGISRAARWMGNDIQPKILAIAPRYSQSEAVMVSAGGDVIVGAMMNASGAVAARWVDGVPSLLGTLPGESTSTAAFVSADGSTIVGRSGARFFRWRQGAGMTALAIDLPAGMSISGLQRVNDDATAAVGEARIDAVNQYVPFIWTEKTGVEIIDDGPKGTSFFPKSASGDCSRIVGNMIAPGNGGGAAMWTSSGGLVNLNTYLPSIGVNIDDWRLHVVTAMSRDGMAIAGNGIYKNVYATFYITGLPMTGACAADFNADGTANSQDLFDFLACFFDPRCALADFNGDAQADSQDFFDFLTAFFAGCS